MSHMHSASTKSCRAAIRTDNRANPSNGGFLRLAPRIAENDVGALTGSATGEKIKQTSGELISIQTAVQRAPVSHPLVSVCTLSAWSGR
jgi:hypothetical protein